MWVLFIVIKRFEMSRKLEELKIVSALKAPMLEKLRSNGHKPHWRECSINDLIEMMEGEIQELKDELIEMNLEEALRECADIANFAAMIYDNINKKFVTKKNIDSKPSLSGKNIVEAFLNEIYDKAESKQKICTTLKITLATISRWRSGDKLPRIDTLDEIWLMVMEARDEA